MFTVPEQNGPIRVDHGCWINGYWDTIDIEQGETQRIMLALLSPFPPKQLSAVSNNHTDPDWFRRTGGQDFAMSPFPEGCEKGECEVLITWGGNSEHRQSFGVSVDFMRLLRF